MPGPLIVIGIFHGRYADLPGDCGLPRASAVGAISSFYGVCGGVCAGDGLYSSHQHAWLLGMQNSLSLHSIARHRLFCALVQTSYFDLIHSVATQHYLLAWMQRRLTRCMFFGAPLYLALRRGRTPFSKKLNSALAVAGHAEGEGVHAQGSRWRLFCNANSTRWQNKVVINHDRRMTARSQEGMQQMPGSQNISNSGW